MAREWKHERQHEGRNKYFLPGDGHPHWVNTGSAEEELFTLSGSAPLPAAFAEQGSLWPAYGTRRRDTLLRGTYHCLLKTPTYEPYSIAQTGYKRYRC